MRIIGLTGGIASGKSTVSDMLRNLGACIIDADKIAREVVRPGEPAWQEIVAHYGRRVLSADGELNRKMLGNIVFNNPGERSLLEKITHPRIKEEIDRQLIAARNQGYDSAVLDIPLLFETGWQKLVDETWVVFVDADTQLARLERRDAVDREQALARIKAQLPLAEKAKLADVVIDNSGELAATKEQVSRAWQESRTGMKA